MSEDRGLFRGKRIDNGKWIQGNLIVRYFVFVENKYEINTRSPDEYYKTYPVDPDTIGEYIGQTDKYNRPIFEDDIVEGADFSAEDGYGQIFWDEDAARFAISGQNLICDFDNYYGYELEVIGNIHDNPELTGEDNGA